VAIPTTEEDMAGSQQAPKKDTGFASFAERLSESKLQTQSGGNLERNDPLQKITEGAKMSAPPKTSPSRYVRKSSPEMLSNQLLEDEDEDFTI